MIGWSPRYSCIDIQDGKKIGYFFVYPFSGDFERGKLVSNSTVCKSPEVLLVGCFCSPSSSKKHFNPYSFYAKTLDFMFVHQVISEPIVMIYNIPEICAKMELISLTLPSTYKFKSCNFDYYKQLENNRE